MPTPLRQRSRPWRPGPPSTGPVLNDSTARSAAQISPTTRRPHDHSLVLWSLREDPAEAALAWEQITLASLPHDLDPTDRPGPGRVCQWHLGAIALSPSEPVGRIAKASSPESEGCGERATAGS